MTDYYQYNGAVIRVAGARYEYFDREQGEWREHHALFDRVHFEAACQPISENEANTLTNATTKE